MYIQWCSRGLRTAVVGPRKRMLVQCCRGQLQSGLITTRFYKTIAPAFGFVHEPKKSLNKSDDDPSK